MIVSRLSLVIAEVERSKISTFGSSRESESLLPPGFGRVAESDLTLFLLDDPPLHDASAAQNNKTKKW